MTKNQFNTNLNILLNTTREDKKGKGLHFTTHSPIFTFLSLPSDKRTVFIAFLDEYIYVKYQFGVHFQGLK